MPHRGEAPPAGTGGASTPKQQCQPGTVITKPKAYLHPNTPTAHVNTVGSPGESQRPYFSISDAAVWALVTLIIGTLLIVGCVLLTLGAPR